MGLAFGVILAFVGIGLLILPFAFSLGVANRIKVGDNADDVEKHQRSLRAGAVFIAIAAFILLIAIIIIWVYAERKGEKKESSLSESLLGEASKGSKGLFGKGLGFIEKNPEILA